MNKNLAIIGASYLQLPLIKRAKELGYTTHVFAWAANDVGEKEADFFYPISIVEKDEICTFAYHNISFTRSDWMQKEKRFCFK